MPLPDRYDWEPVTPRPTDDESTREPVSLAEQKEHQNIVDFEDDNALIKGFITTAREHIEKVCSLVTIQEGLKLRLDAFPCDGVLVIPRGPVIEVTEFQYRDSSGVYQDVDEDLWELNPRSRPPEITLTYESSWPTIRGSPRNDVILTATFGYGETAAAVPQTIRNAIKMLAAYFYENREAIVYVISGGYNRLPLGVRGMLLPYKQVMF